ncbi:transcription antitermination factor NusB [Kyrpidia spormannii]|uniref:Transcription antitermination protein NusB n=1 Tax=Kyrpidia spormannii TaxID=2055160 RepID=A0A2K8N509_9BACL|nr:transcription antitermination factor NusB [Kyrpidia spormannii]ATY84406.1 transcription antitermination factor NusB [Kyrpidia spormannii]
MSRRAAREKVLQALVAVDLGGTDAEEALEQVWRLRGDGEAEGDPSPEDEEFARRLLFGTLEEGRRVDGVLRTYSTGWDLDRMASVDRNVLRLAVYELLHVPATPVSVVMNEAVELAKRYSTEESGRFVNGVLARIVVHLEELRTRVGE